MASNVLINADMIAKVAMISLENNCVLPNLFYRDYENEWKGAKIGTSVRIRKPIKFKVGSGRVITTGSSSANPIQDIKEDYITVTLNKWKCVPWLFNVQELSLNIEEYKKRYIDPAINTIVNQIEQDCAGLYIDVNNACGVSGGIPRTFHDVGAGARELNFCAVPNTPRYVVFNPDGQLELTSKFVTLNIPNIAGPTLKGGKLPSEIAGMQTYMGQNIKSHVAGAICGTTEDIVVTTGVSSTKDKVSSVRMKTTAGGAGGAFAVGDLFTMAGVYQLNPVSRESVGQLLKFVITSAATVTTATGSTAVLVGFKPAMRTTLGGPYQNVSAYPTTNAVITRIDDHTANLAFHKNAFALTMAKLDIPNTFDFASSITENGFAIAVTKGADIKTLEEIIRLDVLYSVDLLYPELACRVLGTTT